MVRLRKCVAPAFHVVIPAQAGMTLVLEPKLDPCLRGDDVNFAQAVTYFGNPQ
jgi:hypothetical protein